MLNGQSERLKIRQAVVVEGKYDKIKVSSVIDAVIVETNGFGLFKDKQKQELLRLYAKTCGIFILTDSDTAGAKIRGYIKSIVPDGEITSLYVPEIFGKERRKTAPSKEGKLGVEGMSADIIRQTFLRAGLLREGEVVRDRVTKQDLYELGLSGAADSRQRRELLCKKLGLPAVMSVPALIDALSALYDREEFISQYTKDRDKLG